MIYTMKTTGIIVEYNPFHQGHIHHIKKTKEITQCDCLVAITSSYFSQRGLPSIISREDKTKLALEHGVNLVLELPACYSCQSADQFAKYAIQSLHEVNVNTICFGSETNDIAQLTQYLNELNNKVDPTKSWNQNLNMNLKPNDILGIQYIKYCKEYNIDPVTIQRNDNYKSATQTRKDYFNHQKQFNDEYFIKTQHWQTYYEYLRKYLVLTPAEQLNAFFLVNEGIEYRLKENAIKYDLYEDFLEHSISKTYTRARIQRTLVFILLQITKVQMETHNTFDQAIILGFDSIGQQLLKENKDKHIVTKHKELNDFLQNIEFNSQFISKKTFTPRKVIYYDR